MPVALICDSCGELLNGCSDPCPECEAAYRLDEALADLYEKTEGHNRNQCACVTCLEILKLE